MRSSLRYFGVVLLLLLPLGCGRSNPPDPPKTKWSTGFWFWEGSAASVTAAGAPVDTIYCQAGSIQREQMFGGNEWKVYGSVPERLPIAREYWFVFRFDGRGLPARDMLAPLAEHIAEVQREAIERRLPVAGIQLDIDSPTSALSKYAGLLREIRKNMPSGLRLSITALLDWFRDGTAVPEVLKHVDEFVPQFYDVASHDRNGAIAAAVDAAKWGPALNRHRKNFRIGIASFGRSRFLRPAGPATGSYAGLVAVGEVTPLDLATNGAFRLDTSRSSARELILRYRATRATRVGYGEFDLGEGYEFTFPTEDSVMSAVQAAKSMGPHVNGVVFFRWPAFNEVMAMSPAQALHAAGVRHTVPRTRLSVVNQGCAAVHCTDLYLTIGSPLSQAPVRYTVRSSSELEYFIPAERMPARMSGPTQIELPLPPYCGRPNMYLGRAVTRNRADFTLSEAR